MSLNHPNRALCVPHETQLHLNLSENKRACSLTCFCLYELCVCVCVCVKNHIKNAAQPTASLLSLLKPPLIKSLTHASSHLSSSLLKPQTHPFFLCACVRVHVCVWSVSAHETDRQTHEHEIHQTSSNSPCNLRLSDTCQAEAKQTVLCHRQQPLIRMNRAGCLAAATDLAHVVAAAADICSPMVMKVLCQHLTTHTHTHTRSC